MPGWKELLQELQPTFDQKGNQIPGLTLDNLRSKYLNKLSAYTGRNTIAYYSGWLKAGKTQNIDINDSDMTGFMNAIRGLDCKKGLDLILHTPGGNPTATEGIVKYLHSKFGNDIRVIVPQIAMSAGTMLACASHEILLGKHSCLGPIDPQFNGTPAYNIVQEFESAKNELIDNPDSRLYWEMMLRKYPIAFYYTVKDGIMLASALVRDWLKTYMFECNDPKISSIVKKLNANNKSHSRHFTFDFCYQLGLKVTALESDQNLQEAVLSVHHAFVISIDASDATKLIENQCGSRYIISQKK